MNPESPPIRKPKKSSTGSQTLEDVARIAGVSGMTVSRAINQPDQVSLKTRNKVWQAIEAIGYIPNQLAGALASNRSQLVAVMLPTIVNSIFAGYVQALTERLARAGYQVLLGLTNYSLDTEEALIAAVISRRPDGIILTGTQHAARSHKLLLASNIAVVETWDMTEQPLDMLVGFSHVAVGRSTADYLLGKNYRRFGLLWLDDVRGTLRLDGMLESLREQGVAPVMVEVVAAPATQQAGREALGRMLESHDFDVIVCSSDELAIGVLTEAHQRGLNTPADLAVMGYGDLAAASQTAPALSTVRVNGATIGTRAAEMLIERLQHGAQTGVATVLDTGFEIIERQSS